jgi:hypothetical protein
MTDDFTDRRLAKLRARIEGMVQRARPDRYEVDAAGRAPWMGRLAERIVADPGISTADLLLISRHGLIDDLFASAGIDGGERR